VFFALAIGVVFFYIADEAVVCPFAFALLSACECNLALVVVWRTIGPFDRSRASCEQRSMVRSGGRWTGSTDVKLASGNTISVSNRETGPA
jgi:hypothetical protein